MFLDAFEGPLDLLLYMIRRQNLDILDIPIADITKQYMEYITLMEGLQLELAGEYLVMAATLAEIKSRMLLPRAVDPNAGEEGDPRADLVRRLQEYERFKTAAENIDRIPRMDRDTWVGSAELGERKILAAAAAGGDAGNAVGIPRRGAARGNVRPPPRAARATVGARAHV